MKFSVKNINLKLQHNTCIVIGIFEPYILSSTAKEIDKISNGYISSLLNKGELKGEIKQTLFLHHIPNMESIYILLVGCGKNYVLSELQYKKIIKKVISIIINTSSREAIFFLNELNIKNHNMYWKIRQAIEIIEDALYKFNQFKTNKTIDYQLCEIIFNINNINEIDIGNLAIKHGSAISTGIKIAKDLGNMPPNICNSSYLASQAHQLSKDFSDNITTDIVNEKQMYNLGMHSYLAVGNGSKNESLMSIIKYKNNLAKNKKPIVLIGKGVTFDSGGISIKPSEGLDEMKYDMCGAAAVYGIMYVLAILQLPINVIGILASCENMLGKNSYHPGDILKTMSGKTVEVINTDAEGRLILCDTMTYAERFKPEIVIDIATLTGACVIALGHHITGLISNNEILSDEIIKASKQSSDKVWLLPMEEEFQEQLKSKYADISNIGGRSGSLITAGCFLSHFAYKYNWAHLDIAGTAWNSGKNKGATGRPVAMLSQFLINRSDSTIN